MRIGNTQPCIGTFLACHMHIRTLVDWLLRILLIVGRYYYLSAPRLTSLYDVVAVDSIRSTASLLPQALFGDSACDGTRSQRCAANYLRARQRRYCGSGRAREGKTI